MTDWVTLDGGRIRLACGDCLKILPELEKRAGSALIEMVETDIIVAAADR